MSVRPCTVFGCGAWVEGGGRCPTHRQPDYRPSAARRGYNGRWRRTRARFLAAHPWCEHEGGCDARAVDVHHRDGLGPLGPRGHDPENLQSLCHSHHSALTAREVFAR